MIKNSTEAQMIFWLRDAVRDHAWAVRHPEADIAAAEGEVERCARVCIRAGCSVDEVAKTIKEAV